MKLATGVTALALAAMANAATFTVTVGIRETDGQQGLGFDPSAILPQAGDTIEFTFQLPGYIKNGVDVQHTVTQSTFEAPCTPKEGGFDTGLQTTTTTGGKTFALPVNDTQPLWFYSYANNDCNAPMVLAVNPPLTGQTAASFQEAAKTATINHPVPHSSSSSSSSQPSKTSTGSGSGPTGGSGSGGGAMANEINSVLAFSAFLLALM
ncbi:hypothetical protein BDM02DRAFT_3190193 [Thelephora ganbajun]|uniref:Uncharacterized protein n=1 Tax=Thelephora ganbajun TaxID=370292 RepID=A0ACB6Z5X6_THEGA|nr:hypothetical protein BDM02DRAFT_3190193 [Thelephora ganbajun]